jgi:ferredoxin-thioredoxin reductase catalytic subunit
MAKDHIDDVSVISTVERLTQEAEQGGYHLNPDTEMTRDLVRGLLTNEGRFGYWVCPCRLGSGEKDADLDIICPCDYRDIDLDEHGCCYCSLYVSQEAARGERRIGPIPERRPSESERRKPSLTASDSGPAGHGPSLPLPVWRCKVCGYLCARDGPPETCPICKAKKDRFERFM